MKHFFALLAVALLMLAATQESQAQKGYGGGGYGYGGYAGNGYGGGGYGRLHGGHMQGGYGAYCGGCNYPCYHGFDSRMYNVPMMPPPGYQAGPPTPAVTYPYYTVRGPRDFLMNNPPSLGP